MDLSASKYCPQCGKELEPYAIRCKYCDTELANNKNQNYYKKFEKPRNIKKLKIWLIISSITGIIGAIIGIYMWGWISGLIGFLIGFFAPIFLILALSSY